MHLPVLPVRDDPPMPISIDRLPLEELQAVLSVDPHDLDEELACAVQDFVDRIGGRENARLAVEMLQQMAERPDWL